MLSHDNVSAVICVLVNAQPRQLWFTDLALFHVSKSRYYSTALLVVCAMMTMCALLIVLQLTWSAKSLLQTYKSIEFACEHMIGYLPLSHIAAQVSWTLCVPDYSKHVHLSTHNDIYTVYLHI